MEANTLNNGNPVDIDTLMARIREAVDKRTATLSAPSTNGNHGPAQAQADLNLALVESLDSIAGFLKTGQKDLAVIEARVVQGTDQAHQVGELTNRLSARMEEVDQRVEKATSRSAELERKTSQDLQALDRVWQQLFGSLQQRLDAVGDRYEHAFEEMTAQVNSVHTLLRESHAQVEARTSQAEARENEWRKQMRDTQGSSYTASSELGQQTNQLAGLVQALLEKVEVISVQTMERLSDLDRRLIEVVSEEQAYEERLANRLSLLEEKIGRAVEDGLSRQEQNLESLEHDNQVAAAPWEARLWEQWQETHRQTMERLGQLEDRLAEVVEEGRAQQPNWVNQLPLLEQRMTLAMEAAAEERYREQAELRRRIDAEVEQRLAQIREHVTQELAQLEAAVRECDQDCRANLSSAVEWERRTTHELDELRMRLLRSERKARTLAAPQPPAEPAPTATLPVACAAPSQPAIDYFLFEHRFRGSRAEIKRRQCIYLELFRDKKSVLDVGCGRGEFVELLRDNGVPVTGVDMNEDMAEHCIDRGLPVTRVDAFVHLAGLPDASLDGIFSAQVVEHFSIEQIVTLLRLCAAKLRPGGVMVLETINPNCLLAMNWFYLDPTHVRPVPADLLRFLLEQELFEVETLKFSSPLVGTNVPEVLDTPQPLPSQVAVYQDYAVVARKR